MLRLELLSLFTWVSVWRQFVELEPHSVVGAVSFPLPVVSISPLFLLLVRVSLPVYIIALRRKYTTTLHTQPPSKWSIAGLRTCKRGPCYNCHMSHSAQTIWEFCSLSLTHTQYGTDYFASLATHKPILLCREISSFLVTTAGSICCK